jgi:hypothetical protein
LTGPGEKIGAALTSWTAPYPDRQTPLMPRSGFDTAGTLCDILSKISKKLIALIFPFQLILFLD